MGKIEKKRTRTRGCLTYLVSTQDTNGCMYIISFKPLNNTTSTPHMKKQRQRKVHCVGQSHSGARPEAHLTPGTGPARAPGGRCTHPPTPSQHELSKEPFLHRLGMNQNHSPNQPSTKRCGTPLGMLKTLRVGVEGERFGVFVFLKGSTGLTETKKHSSTLNPHRTEKKTEAQGRRGKGLTDEHCVITAPRKRRAWHC